MSPRPTNIPRTLENDFPEGRLDSLRTDNVVVRVKPGKRETGQFYVTIDHASRRVEDAGNPTANDMKGDVSNDMKAQGTPRRHVKRHEGAENPTATCRTTRRPKEPQSKDMKADGTQCRRNGEGRALEQSRLAQPPYPLTQRTLIVILTSPGTMAGPCFFPWTDPKVLHDLSFHCVKAAERIGIGMIQGLCRQEHN
jgi:hypothetical protein